MATILLSAAGAAIGGSIGGTALGLSMVAVGRFAGATLGRVLDQRLLGGGSDAVETGRVDRFRLTGSGEGEPIAQLFGRMRMGGHVIWATEFMETATKRGGKGAPSRPKTTEYSYAISLAVALCQGQIGGVGRIWADGVELSTKDLNMRVYPGDQMQGPDPKIEAVEGAGKVPAYRGTAYVVFEDLDLAPFGNRVPQFTFEVMRPDEVATRDVPDPVHLLRGVAMMPGTGEYALATTPVTFNYGPGQSASANVNTPSGKSDFATSLEALQRELPNVGATSLIVSWFGDDLRAGQCTIRPKVEQGAHDGKEMPWTSAGLTRAQAQVVAEVEDRPVYGGTPADASVIEAIAALKAQGQAVMFYPFVLMDQLAGNGLPDPWSDAQDQPALPWRGRITGSVAPGLAGSPDGTVVAAQEVAQFFGTASASDFTVAAGSVTYAGPQEWSYRRFILHNAAVCAAAGGVDAFCIGSEMRSLTQLRSDAGFPAVAEMQALAAEVRVLLGASVKLGYAADWSEYFGYQPQDGSGDRYFHLDPLWADANIDFIGIDNYMPLSDWRDSEDHADAEWRSIYNLDYLMANIEGGEGYDWFYHSPEAQAAQIRTPITDAGHDEAWIWRYKDIRNWWMLPHHERIGGMRQETPTDWVPQSKPVWFTELGCAAIDKGTNEPNKFLDPKSSESSLPKYSDGRRDDLIQMQYLRALCSYWQRDDNNPLSEVYGGPMLDMSRAFVWAWDARPYPFFPGNRDLWSDGANYERGHWITGRMASRSLSSVVAEICEAAGLTAYDTRGLYGVVRGYALSEVTEARAALQPLMLRFGFDAVERDGVLRFIMRDGRLDWTLAADALAVTSEKDGLIEQARASEADMVGRVRLRFVETDGDYEVISEETVLPDEATHAVAASEVPLVMTRSEGRQVVERWLNEARVSRDSLSFALPPSALAVGAGDVVRIDGADVGGLYRIDRIEQGLAQNIEAVRIDAEIYRPVDIVDESTSLRPFVPPLPVLPLFMDLPLMTGDEVPHAPHLALSAEPWSGSVAVYDAATEDNFALNGVFTTRATVGVTQTALAAHASGIIDRGAPLQVKLTSGQLESITEEAMLAGGNLMAVGDGSPDNWELFQFQSAELVAPDTYLLRDRLRGQFGSDAIAPDIWPEGSYVVLLDGAARQIDLASNTRGMSRNYRIGPARRGYDDPSYVAITAAFYGNGLRPYAPVHLMASPQLGGDLRFDWTRRTRLDGDGWDGTDVPIGEDTESYILRLRVGPQVIREVVLSSPQWTYDATAQAADALGTAFVVEVAQVSARFGPGPFAQLTIAA